MTRRIEAYECRNCGSIVKVWQQGGGGLTCCGAALKLLGATRKEAFWEKQAPLIDLSEVMVDGQSCWLFLTPGEAPEAGLTIPAENLDLRKYGNLHGLWKA